MTDYIKRHVLPRTNLRLVEPHSDGLLTGRKLVLQIAQLHKLFLSSEECDCILFEYTGFPLTTMEELTTQINHACQEFKAEQP